MDFGSSPDEHVWTDGQLLVRDELTGITARSAGRIKSELPVKTKMLDSLQQANRTSFDMARGKAYPLTTAYPLDQGMSASYRQISPSQMTKLILDESSPGMEISFPDVAESPLLQRMVPWVADFLTARQVSLSRANWQMFPIPSEMSVVLDQEQEPEVHAILQQALQILEITASAGAYTDMTDPRTIRDGMRQDKGKKKEAASSQGFLLDSCLISPSSKRLSASDSSGTSSGTSSQSDWSQDTENSMTSIDTIEEVADKKWEKARLKGAGQLTVRQIMSSFRRGTTKAPFSQQSMADKMDGKAPTHPPLDTGDGDLSLIFDPQNSSFFAAVLYRSSNGEHPKPDVSSSLVQATYDCTGCMEQVHREQSVLLSCSHNYCTECFGQMVMVSAKNESQWPVKCCLTEIPRKTITTYLSGEQLEFFQQKCREYAVPAGDRFYCTNVPDCGRFFVPAERGQDTVTCTHCQYTMCFTCHGELHNREERCLSDPNLQAVIREADMRGWRTCQTCRAIIEYTYGCLHMTCICGNEFCYVCEGQWLTCTCTIEDLNNYLETHGRTGPYRPPIQEPLQRPRPRPRGLLGRLRERKRIAKSNREAREREMQEYELDRQRVMQRQQEIQDELEAEELEREIAAVAEQERAEREARRQLEEAEAQVMEKSRQRKITLFSQRSESILQDRLSLLYSKIRTRHLRQMSAAEKAAVEVEQLIKSTQADCLERKEKHALEVCVLESRQSSELIELHEQMENAVVAANSLGHLEQPSTILGKTNLCSSQREHNGRRVAELTKIQRDERMYLMGSQQRSVERLVNGAHVRLRTILEDIGIAQTVVSEDISQIATEIITSRIQQQMAQKAVDAVADTKWFELLQKASQTLLSERVETLLVSGADAPAFE